MRAEATPAYSEKVGELLPQFRALGMALRPERRRLFHRLFAAAEVARENAENPRDAELYAELLRLRQTYGLFS